MNANTKAILKVKNFAGEAVQRLLKMLNEWAVLICCMPRWECWWSQEEKRWWYTNYDSTYYEEISWWN